MCFLTEVFPFLFRRAVRMPHNCNLDGHAYKYNYHTGKSSTCSECGHILRAKS